MRNLVEQNEERTRCGHLPEPESYRHFEQSPLLAQTMWLENSIGPCFDALFLDHADDNDKQFMVERLTTALEGMKMTREEKEVIIARYQEATNRTSPILVESVKKILLMKQKT